jgi:hypothetical protein
LCTKEFYDEPVYDQRVRSDPPSIRRRPVISALVGASARPIAVKLRYILKVKDGLGPGYWWVECNACDGAWQVPDYAAYVGDDESAAGPRR